MELVCFVWISEQTASFAVHSMERLGYVTEAESVYCTVRTESLYNTDTFRLQMVNSEFCVILCSNSIVGRGVVLTGN
jgi:hypothetical protein